MENATRSVLEWREEYSVGVALIDEQHRNLFRMINELIDVINAVPTTERIAPILKGLIEYKQKHFATEEGYFHQFNFEGAEEHIADCEECRAAAGRPPAPPILRGAGPEH